MQKFITLATLMSTLLFAQSSNAQSAPAADIGLDFQSI